MAEFDQWATCTCGHRMSLHRDHGTRDPKIQHPCRSQKCGCENFMKKVKED